MRKTAILVTALLMSYACFSQSLSINTDGSSADVSAILDVKSVTKGMLVPRMSKAERNAIVAPATGLLVFQQAPDSIGFHYYDGAAWTWLEALGNAGWKTRGNAGTDTSINFIGTTDNMPLHFRQNNIKIAEWNRNKRNYSIGSGAGNSNSIANGHISIGDSTGTSFNGTTAAGVLLGTFAGKNLTNGFNPVMIGLRAGEHNTSGGGNVFVGTVAGRFNTTGAGNTYIGHFAGETGTIGSNNTAVGVSSLSANIRGSSNTAVGAGADAGSDSLVNITAIGALSRVDTSNAMVLGSINGVNGATTNVNVAIGTPLPRAAFHVSRGSSGNTITMPSNRISLFEDNSSNYIQLLSPNANETGILAGNAATLIKGGIVFSADSGMMLRTGGNNTRIIANKNGFVGIGNLSPQSRLHVSAGITPGALYASALGIFESNSNSYIQLMNPSTGTAGIFSGTDVSSARSSLVFNTDSSILFNAPGFSTRMQIKNDGDVLIPGFLGINNNTPQTRLHVSTGFTPGAVFATTASGIFESATSSTIQMMNPSSGFAAIISGTELNAARSSIMFNPDSSIAFNSPSFSSRMVVRNNGHVTIPGFLGIGNTLPQTPLHVSDGTTSGASYLASASAIIESNLTNIMQLMNPASASAMIVSGTDLSTGRSSISFNADSSIQFGTGGFIPRVTISRTGNVGFNNITPAALVDANGTFKLGVLGTINAALLKNNILIDAGAIPANGELDVTVAVANAATTGAVYVSPSIDLPAGVIIGSARVSSAGNVRIRYRNLTAAPIDPPATTYFISIVQ